ncbi:uncharacterized protein FA14DRAFT_179612 [Meira miltonrushii]|uniref:DUF2423 domain-containing protein n=1 Tax=Meira miltonrushii TaxID=1280837 RepID=A0A316VJQ0_9BASI|nr:uncharacterized protein FA14DRAFT_179612 [Meira miltonrushii]PWN36251.1 hypothetical protein FA14DRAFT_179612 [Meira miltonrushii]
MAKGLRASSKVKARNARRYTPGTDYQVIHAARLNSISQRLMSRMNQGDDERTESAEDKDSTKAQDATTAQSDVQTNKVDSMQTDEEKKEAAPEKKISTSGPRNNRREQWRKARGWSAKKTGTQKGVKGKRRR